MGDTPTPRLDKADEARPAHAHRPETGARPAGEHSPRSHQEPRKREARYLDTPRATAPGSVAQTITNNDDDRARMPPATGRRARIRHHRQKPAPPLTNSKPAH